MASTTDSTRMKEGSGRIRQKWEQIKKQEIPLSQYWDDHATKRFATETEKLWDREIAAIRLEWNTSSTADTFPSVLSLRRADFEAKRQETLQSLQVKRLQRLLEEEYEEEWLEFRKNEIQRSSERKERRKSAPRRVITNAPKKGEVTGKTVEAPPFSSPDGPTHQSDKQNQTTT